MANMQNTNTFFVDTAGSLTTIANTRVSHILFTPDAAFDAIELRDTDASGAIKFRARGAVAKQTLEFQFITPIVFPKGIYVNVLTANATAILVTSGPGVTI